MDCKIDKTTLNSNAVQKVSTLKPPTILVHNKMIMALMTKRKSPKVITVTGSVSKTNSGFTKRLSSPKTMATIIEVVKLDTVTPFIK